MPNPPSTQSVCPTCGSTDPELHPGIGVMGIADPCSDDFHSPDTQTEERGGSMDAHSRGVLAGDDICSGCGYAYSACICPPPDPQGQVETCERCGSPVDPVSHKSLYDFDVNVPIAELRSQLDQAERRAEEAKADASEANHQANMMSRNLQAANALAASYRQGLRYILGEDVAGYDAHMRPDEVARKLLNPSSTSEGDA